MPSRQPRNDRARRVAGKALALAIEVETLAEMYWRALQVGEPKLLPAEEMAVVLAKFATYGQQA
jgi:L-fuculose-phosphate aldolase